MPKFGIMQGKPLRQVGGYGGVPSVQKTDTSGWGELTETLKAKEKIEAAFELKKKENFAKNKNIILKTRLAEYEQLVKENPQDYSIERIDEDKKNMIEEAMVGVDPMFSDDTRINMEYEGAKFDATTSGYIHEHTINESKAILENEIKTESSPEIMLTSILEASNSGIISPQEIDTYMRFAGDRIDVLVNEMAELPNAVREVDAMLDSPAVNALKTSKEVQDLKNLARENMVYRDAQQNIGFALNYISEDAKEPDIRKRYTELPTKKLIELKKRILDVQKVQMEYDEWQKSENQIKTTEGVISNVRDEKWNSVQALNEINRLEAMNKVDKSGSFSIDKKTADALRSYVTSANVIDIKKNIDYIDEVQKSIRRIELKLQSGLSLKEISKANEDIVKALGMLNEEVGGGHLDNKKYEKYRDMLMAQKAKAEQLATEGYTGIGGKGLSKYQKQEFEKEKRANILIPDFSVDDAQKYFEKHVSDKDAQVRLGMEYVLRRAKEERSFWETLTDKSETGGVNFWQKLREQKQKNMDEAKKILSDYNLGLLPELTEIPKRTDRGSVKKYKVGDEREDVNGNIYILQDNGKWKPKSIPKTK